MANIDELLLRPTLENEEQESAAAGALRRERGAAKAEAPESRGEEEMTLRQMVAQAKKSAAMPPAGAIPAGEAGGEAPSPSAAGTAALLKAAWLNIIDSFGLTLIYINLHLFGHSVFGEKVFCELGEEWLPNKLRSGLGSEAVKDKIKAVALLEKIVLIFVDAAALFALLLLIAIVLYLTNPWNIVKLVVPGV
jgi:hypothetical protein